MNKRIYLSSPTMHDLEMKYIQEAFDTNWVAPLGKNVDEFENEMASLVVLKNRTRCQVSYTWLLLNSFNRLQKKRYKWNRLAPKAA
jgi:dTDP-4-amino-4,6-dideoxygalactose transaminase